ncbi:hypothetical protein CNBD0960 [Cryptococcus deneoformans B-3501A]|uniref:Expressed protein n=1 Tax=Cryptococcus deneoformans (strain JEC21 / ATCC MYA-565) TaxID=214684 RepID=Q5KHT2_CRYD1|nr:expressed protein [Cryptococcus neoformans var. neoformans JEC21]XP_776047.1 hypothetical protein CNBD0960 [Cryptococcus neoformans var. neoformans B-3501A]AAW43228.1 expressed protein [Cryptococcus neoformans var. neoformans JEC21]EAL21400.1 hypothetical protein CNBD0960 [Cryptococcus neoformans var. neoformans B-3501A]
MDRTADDIFDEGDSLFSLPGPSNPRPLFRTPSTANSHNASNNAHTNSLRFRHHDPRFSSPVSVDYDPDGSGYSYQNASVIQGDEDLSGIADNGDGPSFEHGYEATLDREAEMAGIPVEEADGEVEESYDDASDGSSDLYDPDADPEAFAKRLDELAGVLEMNEVEATALKWDPPIGKDHRHHPHLHSSDFKSLIKHYLTTTSWQYSPSRPFFSTPGEGSSANGLDSRFSFGSDAFPFPVPGPWGIGDIGGIAAGEIHPIRVLGRTWRDADGAIGGERSFGVELEETGLENEISRPSEMSP